MNVFDDISQNDIAVVLFDQKMAENIRFKLKHWKFVNPKPKCPIVGCRIRVKYLSVGHMREM